MKGWYIVNTEFENFQEKLNIIKNRRKIQNPILALFIYNLTIINILFIVIIYRTDTKI